MVSGIFICPMELKTSKKGNNYFAGYCGRLNFALLKSSDLSSNGQPVWNLFVDGKHQIPSAPKTGAPKPAQDKTAMTAEGPTNDDEPPF